MTASSTRNIASDLARSPMRAVFSRKWGMSRVNVAGKATASHWRLLGTSSMMLGLEGGDMILGSVCSSEHFSLHASSSWTCYGA